MPKFIGPYPIMASRLELSTYELDLPHSLKSQQIHPNFHVSQLQWHEPNDDVLFPHWEVKVFYNFGVDLEDEWLMDAIVGHRWEGHHWECKVRWNLRDMTWELYTGMKELAALDNYLALQGVESWRVLPKHPQTMHGQSTHAGK
jgi:hypothetical protein